MSPEQLLPLLLGPAGLTVGAMFVVYKFSTGQWISRERLDEKERDRREAVDLLDKALGGNESIARAMEERNRLEKEIASRGGGSALSTGLDDAETAITRRRRTT